MCKFESCDLNPVDVFRDTPLDNAYMQSHRPIAALLEDAGALSGSDPSLQAKAAEVRSWIRNMEEKRRIDRQNEVLESLPEQRVVKATTVVVRAQTEFVQVWQMQCIDILPRRRCRTRYCTGEQCWTLDGYLQLRKL